MQASNIKNIRALISTLRSKGYVIYEEPEKLNIVGVRSNSTTPNKFDDKIYAFWKTKQGEWKGKFWQATTDPGTYYLNNPLSKLGTAILKQGQYVDSYAIGLHKGQYTALVQVKPVTVIRDYDRNAVLDFNNGREETGLFGINIHKAGKNSSEVDQWSAGCQVFSKSADFNEFIELAQKQKSLYGNKFTYTLIDERSYNRYLKRVGVYIGLTLATMALWVGFRAYKRKPIIPKF
jgi:hypothetical protein